MKCAYFVRPHIGGTYSVFTRLSASLRQSGVELRWLAAGAAGETISFPSADQGLSEALRKGDAIDRMGVLDEETRARRMIAFLRDNNFKAVFVNVLSSRFETNLVRYLPDDILRIMIVHNITPGTYAAAHEIRDHVHATVGVSKRCRDDLVKHYGFDAERTLVIPHGLNRTIHVQDSVVQSSHSAPLRLLYLGRIEDNSKGVFWLPNIMRELKCDYHLTVAGDGPDLNELRHRLQSFGDKVSFTSWVAPSDVPYLVSQHDVMLMPSRFEGFGLTLIEAMSEGCPAVVSKIAGVTDYIVTNGEDGLLFPVGDFKQAARHINRLADNRQLLAEMAKAARLKVAVAFDNDVSGLAYAGLLENLVKNPPAIAAPLPLSQWKMPTALHSSLRSRLPKPVKNWLRQMRERLRSVWTERKWA
ncbi:glycosyltransferase family 4 protein [Brucella sp. 21LCYQ03]|nr:glycosyltransferase family 4 protein [Brucella sp. 21LCYQ03]